RQEFVEFDKTVDETERKLRSEDGIFAPADARIGFKNRIARLLNGERQNFADIGDVFGGLAAKHCDAAKTDVMQLVKRRLHSDARRKMREKFTRFITRRAEPNFAATRTP